MSRFLSAPKTCLVLLIELYRSNEAQASDSITILSFLSHHILSRTSDPSSDSPDSRLPTISAIKDFETLLSPLESNFPGRSLYDVFLRHLWALTGLEQLKDLFELVSRDLVPAKPILTLSRPERRSESGGVKD